MGNWLKIRMNALLFIDISYVLCEKILLIKIHFNFYKKLAKPIHALLAFSLYIIYQLLTILNRRPATINPYNLPSHIGGLISC